jgi:integrase
VGVRKVRPSFCDDNPWLRANRAVRPGEEEDTVFWQPEQLQKFLAWAATKANPTYAPAWQFLAATGDRRSAYLGVKWEDIDFERREVRMCRYVKEEDGTKRVVIQPFGKTKKQSLLPLDPWTLSLLRQQEMRVENQRMGAGDVHTCPSDDYDCDAPGYHDRGLVFPAIDGNYIKPYNLLRELQRATARYNLDMDLSPDDDRFLPTVHIHPSATLGCR